MDKCCWNCKHWDCLSTNMDCCSGQCKISEGIVCTHFACVCPSHEWTEEANVVMQLKKENERLKKRVEELAEIIERQDIERKQK